jgi:hypothetical protein
VSRRDLTLGRCIIAVLNAFGDRAASSVPTCDYLVNEELLSRTPDGTYWRSGGTVPVEDR